MTDDYLAQGITAVKAGNKQEARQLLDAAIRAAPNDLRTWGWFYNVCENDDERLRCIKEILRIEPSNEKAKQRYNELVGLGFQQPIPVTQQQVPSSEGTDAISIIIIVVLIIQILALIGVFAARFFVAKFAETSSFEAFCNGIFELLLSLASLGGIVDVAKKSKRVPRELILLACVGGGYSLINVFMGGYLQLCFIPAYIIIAALAYANRKWYIK